MKDPKEVIDEMMADLTKELEQKAPHTPELGSEDSQKFFATNDRLAATAASERAARTLARFRFAPPEPHWWDSLLAICACYGVVILLGAAGLWAAIKIYHGGY